MEDGSVDADQGALIVAACGEGEAAEKVLLAASPCCRTMRKSATSSIPLPAKWFSFWAASPPRKAVLDALWDELHQHDYLPVLFDFEKPASRDLTETVPTLAHLARFIIADLTEPHTIPHEVATIIPQCEVPVQPLLVQGDAIHEYPMFRDLRMYPW